MGPAGQDGPRAATAGWLYAHPGSWLESQVLALLYSGYAWIEQEPTLNARRKKHENVGRKRAVCAKVGSDGGRGVHGTSGTGGACTPPLAGSKPSAPSPISHGVLREGPQPWRQCERGLLSWRAGAVPGRGGSRPGLLAGDILGTLGNSAVCRTLLRDWCHRECHFLTCGFLRSRRGLNSFACSVYTFLAPTFLVLGWQHYAPRQRDWGSVAAPGDAGAPLGSEGCSSQQ